MGVALALPGRDGAGSRTGCRSRAETEAVIEFGRPSCGGLGCAIEGRHRVEAERVVERRRTALAGVGALERTGDRLLERVRQIGRAWPSRLFLDCG